MNSLSEDVNTVFMFTLYKLHSILRDNYFCPILSFSLAMIRSQLNCTRGNLAKAITKIRRKRINCAGCSEQKLCLLSELSGLGGELAAINDCLVNELNTGQSESNDVYTSLLAKISPDLTVIICRMKRSFIDISRNILLHVATLCQIWPKWRWRSMMMTADGFSSGILFHFDYLHYKFLLGINCHNSLQILHEVPSSFKNARGKGSLLEFMIFQGSARTDVIAVRHYTTRPTSLYTYYNARNNRFKFLQLEKWVVQVDTVDYLLSNMI